jgi:hypothetical protein
LYEGVYTVRLAIDLVTQSHQDIKTAEYFNISDAAKIIAALGKLI